MVPASKNKLKCRNCGFEKESAAEEIVRNTKKRRKEVVIIEDNRPSLPETNKECEKCGNKNAWYWLIQTRSADEPPTQFFKCTKCGHIWREYK
jgi:DNA-directed RNA polymerase subunit M